MTFTVQSRGPAPFMRCYCSICRKTAGAGGFAINLGADAATLEVTGKENVSVYQAKLDDGISPAERHFCRRCGSALWLFDSRWPELVHPHASAIDTPLPQPPAFVDMMLAAAPPWVALHDGDTIDRFDDYPTESIEQWHRRHGLWEG